MKTKDRINVLEDAIVEIRGLIESMPSGIEYDADPEDESPDDMFAHICGLMWQVCNRAILNKELARAIGNWIDHAPMPNGLNGPVGDGAGRE